MSLTSRLTRCALAVALAGVALTAPSPASALIPAAPEVGSCHDITWAEYNQAADPDPEVSCESPHTSRTFLAPQVPDDIAMDDDAALRQFVLRRCGRAYTEAVSPDKRRELMSSYGWFWFTPTTSQVEDGARWVRCDLGLWGGKHKLAPLPTIARTPALGPAPHPDKEARCWTGKKDGYWLTVCAKSHAFRATGPFRMKGKKFPSPAAFEKFAAPRCKRVSDNDKWSYFYPTKAQWRSGFKWVQCADQTNK